MKNILQQELKKIIKEQFFCKTKEASLNGQAYWIISKKNWNIISNNIAKEMANLIYEYKKSIR